MDVIFYMQQLGIMKYFSGKSKQKIIELAHLMNIADAIRMVPSDLGTIPYRIRRKINKQRRKDKR